MVADQLKDQIMDVKLFQKARDVIADEIVGCSFQSGNKQDSLNRAEEIIVALEAAGITFVSKTE
jgi:hypothetical protein